MPAVPPAADRPDPAAELLTTGDVAQMLRVSPKTVTRRPPPGRVRLGRAVRYSAPAVRRWIADGCPPGAAAGGR